jgi:predicted nucleic acid-binding protein
LSQFVLDCSVAISWSFADESNTYADAVLESLSTSEAVVLSIWFLEIVNVLLVAERRQRITEADTTEVLALLQSLPITVYPDTINQAMGATLVLGRNYNLAAYDAAYLELVTRLNIPLATIDNKLAEAATHCAVQLVNPLEV